MHLVDTILEWARVESGRCQLSVEEFDLSALVSEVVGELASYAKQKRIALALVREPGLPHVASDRRLVRLLLVNLISRAVQVTREGVVEISVLSSQRGHDIVVRDCAPPIPPDKRAELFDPLRGARDLADVSGAGSGLGLHVVRDIAHALDGNVALVPAEGYGNELVLSIPTLASDRTTTRILVRKGR
jgi:signal transduction histidine kinase